MAVLVEIGGRDAPRPQQRACLFPGQLEVAAARFARVRSAEHQAVGIAGIRPVLVTTDVDVQPAVAVEVTKSASHAGVADVAITAGWGHGDCDGIELPGAFSIDQKCRTGAVIVIVDVQPTVVIEITPIGGLASIYDLRTISDQTERAAVVLVDSVPSGRVDPPVVVVVTPVGTLAVHDLQT